MENHGFGDLHQEVDLGETRETARERYSRQRDLNTLEMVVHRLDAPVVVHDQKHEDIERRW